MAIPDAARVAYRTASEADFDALARLWLVSWQSTGLAVTRFATEEGNRRRISVEVGNGWKVTLALAGQRIVGFLAIKPAVSVRDQLFIAPDMKRKGIGKALLERAKAEMPGGFTLRTAIENFDACAFYERCGLERVMNGVDLSVSEPRSIRRWVTLLPSIAGANERANEAETGHVWVRPDDYLVGKSRRGVKAGRYDEASKPQSVARGTESSSPDHSSGEAAKLGVYGGMNENFVLVAGRDGYQAEGV